MTKIDLAKFVHRSPTPTTLRATLAHPMKAKKQSKAVVNTILKHSMNGKTQSKSKHVTFNTRVEKCVFIDDVIRGNVAPVHSTSERECIEKEIREYNCEMVIHPDSRCSKLSREEQDRYRKRTVECENVKLRWEKMGPVISPSHQTCSHYVLENFVKQDQTVCERSGRSSNVSRSVYKRHGRAWTRRDSRTSSLFTIFWQPFRAAIRRINNVVKTRWTY